MFVDLKNFQTRIIGGLKQRQVFFVALAWRPFGHTPRDGPSSGGFGGVPPFVSPLLKVTVDLSGSLVQGVSPQIVCPWSSDATLVVIECVVAPVSLRLSGLGVRVRSMAMSLVLVVFGLAIW